MIIGALKRASVTLMAHRLLNRRSAAAATSAQLLALNQVVAERIAAGEPVTAPGVPPTFQNPARLITDDCIRP